MVLARTLAERIEADGPMRLDAWMAACNSAYYAGDDPLGRDFTTAPEISQMFGEMIGGVVGDWWLRAGRPAFALVELGPGHGTLMADAVRVLARLPGLADALAIHLVETSASFRATQRARLAGHDAHWHDDVGSLPDGAPLFVIANEFFDALPVRQRRGGRELHVGLAPHVQTGLEPDAFVPVWLPTDDGADDGADDAEWSPAAAAIAATLAARLAAHGGAVLIIDYGHASGAAAAAADTLQAVHRGECASPFMAPGAHDLTAHVDFAALARAAAPLIAHGPVPQGPWLLGLGIAARAHTLKAAATTAQAAAITAALLRLTAPQQMGAIFQVMALVPPGWPVPAGFGMEPA
jgi:NADH dehydrogenase [ubiquinone] 1 alpha subcomplex assembly factor 7